ncbi:MAG: ATP-dependent DNA helicase [Desulfobacterales bacterium]|nr:ATP-dependent DNA helicase [Desulfobacterales bacterium]MDH4009583.1 ATP-dependent DNA helicase [Desulfobacterales bacterium]
MKSELKIAVRDLIEHVFRSGDLVFEFLGSSRPVDGIRAHQKIQNSRPDTYQPEVSISHQVETDRFRLIIGGRIDGVYNEPGRTIIEEIKTTTRNPNYFEKNQQPVHWAQVKTYAYIYGRQQGLEEIMTRLTYYQIDTGEIRTFKHTFGIAELEIFFDDLIARYLEWAVTINDWSRRRNESIQDLDFPFVTYRPGQDKMAKEAYRAMCDHSQLLVEATTGIGKTIAVLYPAVKALAEKLSQKIFYLTARTTGRIVAQKALDELRAKGLRLKSVTLTAKDKICFCPDSACNPEECEYARGHFDRINDAVNAIFARDAFTREQIVETARIYRVCPFEFSLDLSRWADCIICDYNYVFDPRVYLRRFFQEENGDYIFLIDEAHNLVDRSREMFSAEIFKQPVLDIRRQLKDNLPHIYKSLGRINAWLVKARKKCAESRNPLAEKDPPEDLIPLLKGFLFITERWLAQNIKTAFRESLLDLYFAVSGFIRVADQYDECYTTCYEKMGKDLKLKLFCIDPSIHLEKAMNRCQVAILFSATMTPMDYFKQILGCDQSAHHLILHSPFPGENLGLYISDQISTYFRHRDQTADQVARVIATLIEQKKGNYLLYFPSYVYMRKIYQSYTARCPQTETILQKPGMAESERDMFLRRFSQNNPQTLVGFAVMGGIFGEGIDLVGKRLMGAVVVGVGLPGISLERELIKEYFTNALGAGFEYAYLYPGINRVLQAAGRVIRTEKDRGVVLLIDQRYGRYQYKSLLREEWDPVRVRDPQQLADGLQKFWKQ